MPISCIKTALLTIWLGGIAAAVACAAQAQTPSDLDAIRATGGEIAAFHAEALGFITGWNATAVACKQAGRVPLGNLRQPCRKIRTALRNGEFLLFARRCVDIGDRHNRQVAAYRAAAETRVAEQAAIESALLGNEQQLVAVCSPATWRDAYPEFAELRVQAAEPRYRLRSNRFYAANPDHRLRAALESTLGATAPASARNAPVTGTGSFAAGSAPGSN